MRCEGVRGVFLLGVPAVARSAVFSWMGAAGLPTYGVAVNVGSLFAGVGGFDLAFERAGMRTVAQVEIDAHCREVLAKHWPDVPRFEDVNAVTADDLYGSVADGLRSKPGVRNARNISGRQSYAVSGMDSDRGGTNGRRAIDVLCGGFPCQDYSVAGRRGGLVGERGALWWQFHRLIAECRPTWIVGENVPGLLSSNGGKDFGTIVGSLVELGYGVVWRVLDAQYFGVAQRRRRVFIVGHFGGQPRPEILSFAEGCAWDSPPRRPTRQTVAPTLASRTNGGGGLGTDHDLDGGLITFNWQSGQDQLSARESHTDALHAGQTPAIAFQLRGREGGVQAEVDPEGIVGSLRAGDGGSSRGRMVATAFAQNSRDEVRDLKDLAGSLSAQPGMKQTTYLASTSVRRLTPLECERLQGFPDNWTEGQSDTQRYRQMGNAVAVPVVEWIGRRIMEAV